MARKGILIVFEGADASGKSTQAKLLCSYLQKSGKKTEMISFPRYKTFFGSLIKKYLFGEFGSKDSLKPEAVAMLYALDKYAAADEIRQHLQQGKTIILDRYIASNIAHQGAKFKTAKKQNEFIKWASKLESSLPQPDLTFYLDVPVEVSQKLMEKRKGKKDLHEQDITYLKRTRAIYLKLAKNKNWFKINCTEKKKGRTLMRGKDEIRNEIIARAGKLR